MKSNNISKLFFFSALAALLLFAALAGCNLKSMIRVDVPQPMRSPLHLEGSTVSLADTDSIIEQWELFVRSNTEQFSRSVSDANDRFTLLSSLSDLGIGAGQEAATTIPGGGLLVTALGMLGTLFIPKPGSRDELRREKEASYNAGISVGRGE